MLTYTSASVLVEYCQTDNDCLSKLARVLLSIYVRKKQVNLQNSTATPQMNGCEVCI